MAPLSLTPPYLKKHPLKNGEIYSLPLPTAIAPLLLPPHALVFFTSNTTSFSLCCPFPPPLPFPFSSLFLSPINAPSPSPYPSVHNLSQTLDIPS